MKCKTIHKKIIFFVEGELPAEEMKQIKYHLAECGDCAAFAAEMKKTLAIVEKEKSPAINPFFYTRVKAKLENSFSKEIQVGKNPLFSKILQPAFFSILLLAGIYSGVKIGQPSVGREVYTLNSEQDIIPYLNEMKNETIETFLME